MTAEVRQRVLQWMRDHHGLITAAQALKCGMTRNEIRGMVRRGRWEVVQRGVYRLAGAPVTAAQPHLAAVWRCGDDAYLTAAPALALWGVSGFEPSAGPVVLVATSRSIDGVDFEVRRRHRLGPADKTIWTDVPMATRTRCLVDLAYDTRGRDFRVAVDAVRRVRGTGTQRLRRRAVAALPQRGAQYVIDLVDTGILDMESEGERKFFSAMESISPPFAVQYHVLPDVRVDFAWPDARIVVEYDGEEFHTLPTDQAHDRRRRSRIRAEGWAVMVVDSNDLRDPVRLTRRLLRRRQERLAALAPSPETTNGRLVPDTAQNAH